MSHPTREKSQVIDAINQLGRRVTVADVATSTGLPVLTVSRELNVVAAEVGGHLEVSRSGDLVYAFVPGFANTYITRGFLRFVEVILSYTARFIFYLVKISFGIMLLVSLLIVGVTIFILFFSQNKNNRQRFDVLDLIFLKEIFAFSTKLTPVVYDYNAPTIRRRERGNFLLNCFSFLFGDGDPNEGLDEKRWQVIANVIKKNSNVVTAEQLAPYTGIDPKNEDGVLPVLVRFNGQPEVTEAGNIVYVFPDMSVTAGTTDHLSSRMPPPYLREFPRVFSNLDVAALRPVYMIAGLNFFGSWFLWWMLYGSPHGNVAALFTALMIYGTLFLLVPLVRVIINAYLNTRILVRNKQRAAYAEALLMPTSELTRKLEESRLYKLRDKQVENRDIIYTTEKAALDQEDDLDLRFRTPGVGETFDASPGP